VVLGEKKMKRRETEVRETETPGWERGKVKKS
jgi:hypothetical protein